MKISCSSFASRFKVVSPHAITQEVAQITEADELKRERNSQSCKMEFRRFVLFEELNKGKKSIREGSL